MVASLPFWMGEVPDYEVRNGHMQITIGEFAIAMPVNVFLAGCAKGKAAVITWERHRHADAEVVQFRREFVEPGQH